MIRPVLEFAMRDDGRIECVSPWFPLVTFALDDLQRLQASGWGWVEHEILTIRCVNGTARYQLGLAPPGGAVPGRLVETL